MVRVNPVVFLVAVGCASSHDADSDDAHGGMDASVAASDDEQFSFFVTSLSAMRALSGSQNGFGGDLKFGETGDGAGLRGADKICATIADRSMPGSSAKKWRAFLSTSSVDAKDRVGDGPWYDRKGRLVAMDLQGLLGERPPVFDILAWLEGSGHLSGGSPAPGAGDPPPNG